MSEGEPEVLLRREGGLARITLNRPRAINALNLAMVRQITEALREWADDDAVATVLLDGAGDRGLCAGGDIVTLHDAARSGEHGPAEDFWREEYELDALIARFPKPFAAIMNGIVMGGGVGLVPTRGIASPPRASPSPCPRASASRPTSVGHGFCPGRRGARHPSGADRPADRTRRRDPLRLRRPGDRGRRPRRADRAVALRGSRRRSSQSCLEPARGGEAPAQRAWIDAAYSADRVEEIVERLRDRPEPAAAEAAEAIAAKSPTSVKVALRALREARELPGLEACLERELVTSLAFLDCPDFTEGVRSTVIDKDRDPRWSPPGLEGVTPEMLEPFFAAPAERIGAAR
ncbi:MAG: enoyl-CoA hydratase/isomerase family protein [Solirubrobacterales bacterium]